MNELMNFFDPAHNHFEQLAIILISFLALLLLRAIKSKLSEQRSALLIMSSLNAIYRPAKSFIALTIVWTAFLILDSWLAFNLMLKSYPTIQLLSAVHIGWYSFRVINNYEINALNNTNEGKLDPTAVTGIAKVLRLLLAIILTIVAFDLLGLDASGLIALGSVSGAALAFASKDLVSNWFGGIMLYLDKPFKVGDWIRSPDREIEGTVEYIGWRITKIRTFDKRPLYVPNSLFNSITVQNPSRMTHRRINETLNIRYDDIQQINRLVEAIRTYLKGSDIIAQDQVIIVNFNAFAASSLDILVYCMTITTDWQTFHHHKQKTLLDIANLVEQHECEFAYPTQRIQVEQ